MGRLMFCAFYCAVLSCFKLTTGDGFEDNQEHEVRDSDYYEDVLSVTGKEDLVAGEVAGRLIRPNSNSDKANASGNVILRDNDETRRLHYGRDGTITKVLHHGIYPSLNMAVPIGVSSTKRSVKMKRSTGNLYGNQIWRAPTYNHSSGFVNGSVSRHIATSGHNRTNSVFLKTAYQAEYPFRNSSRLRNNVRQYASGSGYARAQHPQNGDIGFYTRQFNSSQPVPSNSTVNATSVTYRTLYLPANNNSGSGYAGQSDNKGHVRLVSVGYYNVNDSMDGLRSYRNPVKTSTRNRFEPSRWRRDVGGETSWNWLDKMFRSLGMGPKQSDDRQDKSMEVDAIILVTDDSGGGVTTENDGPMLPPTAKPVIIQAPLRTIKCTPPKRLSKGRCRTVW